MAKTKGTSMTSVLVIALVSSAFVSLIAWGSFTDPIRIVIAAGITFVTVFVGLLLLKVFQKDDDVKPGVPRLK
ncbi:MAG: hypothetical protein EBZ61_04700 [Micrococcales bacterium]|nr:hypothetical protein [Micrococcales bacterium]